MTTWILIAFLYIPAQTDAIAVTNVPGFTTEAECQEAGKAVLAAAPYYWHKNKAVCIQQTKPAQVASHD